MNIVFSLPTTSVCNVLLLKNASPCSRGGAASPPLMGYHIQRLRRKDRFVSHRSNAQLQDLRFGRACLVPSSTASGILRRDCRTECQERLLLPRIARNHERTTSYPPRSPWEQPKSSSLAPVLRGEGWGEGQGGECRSCPSTVP